MSLDLIYDRTESDVNAAEDIRAKYQALADWSGLTDEEISQLERGMLTNVTLNRVEAAVQTLAAELNAAGYPAAVEPVLKGDSRLPSGYTELEYIQSSGTQYVDTGLVCSQSDNYKIELDCDLTSSAYYAGANGYLQYQASIAGGARSNLTITYANKVETITVNGTVKKTDDWSNFNDTNVKIGILRLGAANNGWYSSNIQSGKIYSCKIYKKSVLVRDFIPCKNPSGAVGLYDTVNDTFYGNSGAGTFTAGPEIGALEDREWRESDIVRLSQWRQYLANVQALRDAYYTLAETGELPDAADRLDYIGANTIEKILTDIDLLIGWMKSSYRRCGTFQAGNNAAHLPLKGSI